MFAYKPIKETAFRVLLIAVILFNALIPNTIVAQAEQESATTTNSNTQTANQDDDPPPAFERPKPRVGERDSDDSPSTLPVDSGIENLSPSDPQTDFQTRLSEAEKRLKDIKENFKSRQPTPNPVRKITPSSQSPANNQGKKDVFTQRAGSQEKIYTVTTLDDHDDGVCDNDCSLREAIYAANDSAGPDIIKFSISGTIRIDTPLPYMTDLAGLTIDGNGQEVTIGGNSETPSQKSPKVLPRIINPDKITNIVTEAHFSVSRSDALYANPACSFYGPGPFSLDNVNYSDCNVDTDGAVTLTNSTFSNGSFGSESTITIENSTVLDSAFESDGTITIENSTLVDGALISGDDFTVTDSILTDTAMISDNESDFTITNCSCAVTAIISEGAFTITGSSFTDNDAIFSYTTITIDESKFTDAFISSSDAQTITNSVLVRSYAHSSSTLSIHSDDALTLANSAFSGNWDTTSLVYSSIPFVTGDVLIGGDAGSFTNSTILGGIITSDNALTITSNGTLTSINSTFSGASIDSVNSLNLYNTILANVSECGSAVAAGSHNLIETDSTSMCGLTDGVNGNIITSDAKLVAASPNSTSYFELGAGSPAIDAGDNTICAAEPINNTSQNGIVRPQGLNCDIGSFEFPPVINDNNVISACETDDCVASAGLTQGRIMGPINTRTGGYDYSVDDISIHTSAGMLIFNRNYASLGINQPTAFSPGWTHNHATRLILPDDPEGEDGKILFKLHSANLFTFLIQPDDTFVPEPGLMASLTQSSGSPIEYMVIDSSQHQYTFDEDGTLLSYEDAQGHGWTYDYTNGELDLIEAAGGKYLDLDYDAQGRLESVTDHTERTVTYDYDVSTGDLDTVTDVLDQTWTYEYDEELDHFLTRVAAPGNVTVERTEYDTEGRAVRQYDGEDNLLVEITYNMDGTRIITDALEHDSIHTYDARGTLVNDTNAVESESVKGYDGYFRPAIIIDPEGRTTRLLWKNNGANLAKVTDAMGGKTSISYNPLNSPTSIIDPMEYETKYFYEDTNFPTLPTRIEYPLSFDGGVTYIGTDYEYYSSGVAAGKVELVTDALGNQTHYTYNSSGQVETVTTAYGTSDAVTTTYGYDDLERLDDVIDEQGIVTHSEYDAAGRLLKTIRNVHPTITTQNYEDLYNITTEYFYDLRGNQIAVKDTYGVITRTYYDLANRPVTMIQNLTGQTIETASPPNRGIGITDENIRMDTEYDDAGNVIAMTDPAGIVTRTFYDEANRPEIAIQNYVGAGAYNPAYPNENVRTEYTYDANGNVIAIKDTLGIITRTYYDGLNRPKAVVQHLTGQAISVTTIPARGTTSNIRTDMYYDKNGNVIATIDPRNITTRTYYDALNRPITVVQNLVGWGFNNPVPPAAGTGATVANIRSDTYYDEAGNVIATVDPRGTVTRTFYDSANRPIATVQNLIGQDIYVTTIPERGDDANLRTDIAYDDNGRRDTITDPLGRVTKYEYDERGQLVNVTANYVNGLDQNDDNQRNIVTEYAYDALGRQLTVIDTMGRITLNSYDDLGRLLSSKRNNWDGKPQNYEENGNRYNLLTTYVYDERGNQIATTDTAGVKTRSFYDSLGRPVTVVRNLTGSISNTTPPERGDQVDPEENLRTDTVYLGNGNVDYVIDEMGKITNYGYNTLGRLVAVTDPLDKTTAFVYDANGNRTQVTDAKGVSTKYEYDALNRLKAVVENYLSGITPNHEKNVRTEYTYDAGGNRLSILDGKGHNTSFTYTLMGYLETETDALDNTTLYDYNAVGNRVYLKDAKDQETIFEYDEMNRLKTINYPSGTADVSFVYDALGRRTSMTDGLGTTSWSYTNFDLPGSITDPFSAQVSYGYDEALNRDLLVYPDSSEVSYKYNAVNRLEEVTSGQSTIASYLYDAAGRVKTVERANGVDTVYNYLDNGWLESINHDSGTTLLASYQYTYDNVGNRIQAIENVTSPELPPTVTPTFTPTNTATDTVTPTETNTFTPTATNTFTSTATNTFTPTATNTFTPTATPTASPTETASQTATNTPPPVNSGWVNPAANAATTGGDGNGFQTNPANAYSNNAAFAVDTDSGTNTNTSCSNTGKDRHVFRAYNLASFVPSGSTITGIEVRLNMKVDATSGAPKSCVELSWDGGTTWTTPKTSATFTTAEAPYILGGASDDWGRTWSVSELSNFRVRITNVSSNNARDFSLDWTAVRVSYIPSTPTPTFTNTPTLTNTVSPTPTTTPTITPTSTSTFTPTPTASQTPTSPSSELLFADGFESGDFSAWDGGYINPGVNPIVTAQAAAVGNQGMQVFINSGSSNAVIFDDLPTAQKLYSARFYFDPNSISIPDDSRFVIFGGVSSDYTFTLYLVRSGGQYGVVLVTKDDYGNWIEGDLVNITDDWQAIEIDWQAASAPGANNGFIELWLNDTLATQFENLNSDTLGITHIELGSILSIPSGIDGSIYFDAFEARAGSYIGPLSAAPMPRFAQPESGIHLVSYRGSELFAPLPQGEETDTPTFTPTPTATNTPPPQGPITIDYVYDPLYRLTEANYSNGDSYNYTYDAVGNRLTQDTLLGDLPSTTNYLYDDANRLTSVNAVSYVYDNNGNLLDDGVNTYAYDSANRLKTMTSGQVAMSYVYNGLGDRLQETLNGNTTTFTMDLNSGLTQVLDDGTNTYLYGLGRISQTGISTEYFLGDALGSVRQLTDSQGGITLAKSYQPYGRVLSSYGSGASPFAFTGEMMDASGLVYLRARYYSANTSRFLSRDPFPGYSNLPQSQNPYIYGLNNPIRYTDPSGENPLAFLGAFALAIGAGAAGGAIYGCFSYEWAITGQCGCELQQQALLMTKADWVGMHALVGGIASGAIALSTITPLTTIIVGGALVIYAINDFVNVLQVVYSEGVGWTTCNIVRAVLDVAIGIFGGSSVVRGIRAWKATGSLLAWPLPNYVAATFQNGQYRARVLNQDTLAYRGEGTPFGRWYGATKPDSAAAAEQLYNLTIWGNDLLQVSTYRIPKGTLIYEGKVAGGTGWQYYTPDPVASNIKLILTEFLPQFGH